MRSRRGGGRIRTNNCRDSLWTSGKSIGGAIGAFCDDQWVACQAVLFVIGEWAVFFVVVVGIRGMEEEVFVARAMPDLPTSPPGWNQTLCVSPWQGGHTRTYPRRISFVSWKRWTRIITTVAIRLHSKQQHLLQILPSGRKVSTALASILFVNGSTRRCWRHPPTGSLCPVRCIALYKDGSLASLLQSGGENPLSPKSSHKPWQCTPWWCRSAVRGRCHPSDENPCNCLDARNFSQEDVDGRAHLERMSPEASGIGNQQRGPSSWLAHI